jgi:hypothetical protein
VTAFKAQLKRPGSSGVPERSSCCGYTEENADHLKLDRAFLKKKASIFFAQEASDTERRSN